MLTGCFAVDIRYPPSIILWERQNISEYLQFNFLLIVVDLGKVNVIFNLVASFSRFAVLELLFKLQEFHSIISILAKKKLYSCQTYLIGECYITRPKRPSKYYF